MADAAGPYASMIASLGAQVDALLRKEEARLLREKELLLIVLEGRTGTRQLQRRTIELGRLHSEAFAAEFLPLLSATLA